MVHHGAMLNYLNIYTGGVPIEQRNPVRQKDRKANLFINFYCHPIIHDPNGCIRGSTNYDLD